MHTGRGIVLGSGLCALLAVTAQTRAGFTGLSTEERTNEFGLTVVGVYAGFDQPGDMLTAIAGTGANPLELSVIGGTFYQHPSGTDRAPLDALVAIMPSLAYDTFVTIGVSMLDPESDSGGQPVDMMFTTPGWPGFGPSSLASSAASWAIIPMSAQGNPFNPQFAAGDGRTLIAQLSTADGVGFEGSMVVQYMSGGLPGQAVVGFTHMVPGPGVLAFLGLAAIRYRRRRG